MFHQDFYHALIRKYVVLFGSLFNDTFLTRYDPDGNQIGIIKVPIQYAPKEKMMVRLLNDPDLDRQFAVLLPRMSFEIAAPGFAYDSPRKLTSVGRYVVKNSDDLNKVKFQYNPVPYNMFFTLYIYVKSVEDGLKIVEQIIPNFTPDWTPHVHLIPEMNEHRDIPIILTNGPLMTDVYDNDFKKRQMVLWELNFTMKAWFFGPVRNKPIIKYANTTLLVPISTSNNTIDTANAEPVSRTILTPGLLANGSPTSNSSLSIPIAEISIDDDFGFAFDKENLL